jgi:putative protein kinase ArgK-like GTPase of G3E family
MNISDISKLFRSKAAPTAAELEAALHAVRTSEAQAESDWKERLSKHEADAPRMIGDVTAMVKSRLEVTEAEERFTELRIASAEIQAQLNRKQELDDIEALHARWNDSAYSLDKFYALTYEIQSDLEKVSPKIKELARLAESVWGSLAALTL